MLFKSQIGVFIEISKYYPSDIYRELEEDEYTTQILLLNWSQEIDKISTKKHNEYMKFFETIRDLLIENLIEKKTDLKERLELISKYSNNSLVRKLSVPEKLFLYETNCNNLYLDTGKTCKEIGATNKHKEKVEDSAILKEYNREYKRMHGLHYNHSKIFKEKQFKEWSEKARKLRDTYTDENLEKFKIELQKLSSQY